MAMAFLSMMTLLSLAVAHGDTCAAGDVCEESSLLQSSKSASSRALLSQRHQEQEKEEQPIKVLILSTPGAMSPCCGCPKPEEGKRCGCGRHKGTRTYQMAEAIQEGILQSAPNANVTLADISQEGGCPDYEEVKNYDAILAGSPSWNGIMAPDIAAFIDAWPISEYSLRCKVGGAFSTGGGYYAGIQTTIEAFHRLFMTFQMIIVGGPEWNTGVGAAAVTGIYPFDTYADDGSYIPVNDMFLTDGKAFGARIGNVTKAMKAVPELCGEYPGIEEAHKR